MFDIECYVVTVSKTSMKPNLTQNICENIPAVSPDIDVKTTKSTTLRYPILIDIDYSVLVWTVSKCGQLSSPAMVQEDVGFVRVGKQCVLFSFKVVGPLLLH